MVWRPSPFILSHRPLFNYLSCRDLYGSGPEISELERTTKKTGNSKKGLWRSRHTGSILFVMYGVLNIPSNDIDQLLVIVGQ